MSTGPENGRVGSTESSMVPDNWKLVAAITVVGTL